MKPPRTAAGTALDVKDIDSYYGELQVLRRASLSIGDGEVVALFGPNGHGKSTLLKAISGLHPPKAGSIKFRGTEIARVASEKVVDLGVAYIPEARNLFPEMTVQENLKLGAYVKRARSRVEENLETVYQLFPRLLERTNQVASTLSGGESRMLAVGRGLMSGASLLLIDEPSIGLSPLMKRVVFDAVAAIRHKANMTILVVEQEVDYPLKLADRIYLLKKGQVILEKPAAEITKAEIEKAYF
jgi:branched-chain amino acid transport system ATP-binding protein